MSKKAWIILLVITAVLVSIGIWYWYDQEQKKKAIAAAANAAAGAAAGIAAVAPGQGVNVTTPTIATTVAAAPSNAASSIPYIATPAIVGSTPPIRPAAIVPVQTVYVAPTQQQLVQTHAAVAQATGIPSTRRGSTGIFSVGAGGAIAAGNMTAQSMPTVATRPGGGFVVTGAGRP